MPFFVLYLYGLRTETLSPDRLPIFKPEKKEKKAISSGSQLSHPRLDDLSRVEMDVGWN